MHNKHIVWGWHTTLIPYLHVQQIGMAWVQTSHNAFWHQVARAHEHQQSHRSKVSKHLVISNNVLSKWFGEIVYNKFHTACLPNLVRALSTFKGYPKISGPKMETLSTAPTSPRMLTYIINKR
jgi:hypothetical protein